jgi:hypothetical protein
MQKCRQRPRASCRGVEHYFVGGKIALASALNRAQG